MDADNSTSHLAPVDQPASVHQVAQRLFPAYTVDNGGVRLAGCALEDRLFLRFSFRPDGGAVEFYLDADGKELDSQQVGSLGMAETVELDGPPEPPEPVEAEIASIEQLGRQLIEDRSASGSPPERVDVAAVWCKFARGKLRFTVGEHSTDLPFGDWARTLEPPPFICPYTGISTFHLGATDDGRIVPAEAIQRCEETGQLVLSDDLVTCSITGRRVVSQLIENCPISGQPVLREQMAECGICHEKVSPKVVHRSQCEACRNLRPVSKADPRMARLLDEHPSLDTWRSWRISESRAVYILTATGWFRRLLVVFDRDSLDMKLMATGNRFTASWHMVDKSQYDYVLRR